MTIGLAPPPFRDSVATVAARLLLDRFLPYRLSYTASLASEVIARAYKALFGLTIPEWRVIAHVAAGEGVTQQEIGRRTRMDKVTVSRAASALGERGLLVRTAHGRDRRSHLLVLTTPGRALYDQVAPKALELEARIFSRFDQAEIDAFVATLRRIDEVVEEEFGEDA